MQYQSLSVQDPLLQSLGVERDGMIYGPTQLQIPAVAFGDTDASCLALPCPEDANQWPSTIIHLGEVCRFRIANAVVHGPYGIITAGDYVLEETLGHIPFHCEGYGRNGNTVTLPDARIGASLDGAIHVMGGNYFNYYHWLTDILSKLQIEPFAPHAFTGTVLLSPSVSVPSSEIAMLLARAGIAVFSPGDHATQVQRLVFVPNLFGWGFAPNPQVAGFFSDLKRILGITEAPRNRIYVTRRDSKNRILLNEDQIIEAVQGFGFRVAELSGLDLTAQARLFAEASHVIAPHGAGLANLLFCEAGVTFCELHLNTYLNWCFRRIAGVQKLRYGCIVGTALSGERPDWVHDTNWSLPLTKLEAVLRAM